MTLSPRARVQAPPPPESTRKYAWRYQGGFVARLLLFSTGFRACRTCMSTERLGQLANGASCQVESTYLQPQLALFVIYGLLPHGALHSVTIQQVTAQPTRFKKVDCEHSTTPVEHVSRLGLGSSQANYVRFRRQVF